MEAVLQDSRGLGVNWVGRSPSVGLVGKHDSRTIPDVRLSSPP